MLVSLNRTRSRHTKWFIRWVKNRCSNASCAQRHAAERLIYAFTFRSSTHLKLPSSASVATMIFRIDTVTRFTQRHTKAKNVIVVNYALTHPSRHDILNRICLFTRIRSRFNAITAVSSGDKLWNGSLQSFPPQIKPSAKSSCSNDTKTFITIRIT